MATLLTSDLQNFISNSNNELLLDRSIQDLDNVKAINVQKFNSQEQFISNIVPAKTLIDFNTANKIHIIVNFEEGQLQVGEKFKVELLG